MKFKEQLILFKTAKLAKEKGFDYCVNNYYWIDENSLDCGDGDFEFACLNHNKYNDLYSAPNQTELQKWLRENHNIFLTIICDCHNKFDYHGYDVDIMKSKHTTDEYPGFEIGSEKCRFDSYEEALEEGLYEALKLI